MGLTHAIVGLERALLHEFHGIAGHRLQSGDHLGDLVGGVLNAFGQVAYFVGHHREPATLLTGAGGFDRSVERQQVGLLGDAVNHADHTVDLLAVGSELLDHLSGLLHTLGQAGNGFLHPPDHPMAVACKAIGVLRQVAGFAGMFGNLMHRRAHLVDRRGCLVGFALLAAHAAMHIVHARGQPAGALIQARGGLGDGADDALIAALHRIERAGHLTDFVTAVQRHAGLQVAAALDVQHDVLERVQVAEQETDQHLRGGEQTEHQHGDGGGIAEKMLPQYLDHAGSASHNRELLTVGPGQHFHTDQRMGGKQAVVVQCCPAGVGQ